MQEDHQIEELTSAITNRMSFICPTCDYTTTIEWLTETVILCSSQRDQLLLRTIPQCPHDNCYAHFEFWLSLQYQFLKLYNGQILLVDPTCPLYVDSLDSCECRETTSCAAATSSNGGPIATSSIGGPIATSSPGGATATSSLGGAIAGSLIGGLALGCLIWLPVLISVLFYFIKYRPAEKDSEKMSIDLNIQPPKRYTKPQVDDQVSYETVGYFQETDDKYFVDTPPSGISAVQRKKLLMKSVSVGPPARGIRHHAAEEEDNSEYEIPDIGPQETSHDVVHYDYPFHPLPHQKPATAPVTPKTKSTDRISKSQKPSASQTQKLQSIPQASGQNPQLHSKPAASIGPAASHQKQQVPPKSAETKSTDQPSTSQKPSASQTQKLQSIPQASGQNPRFHSKVSVAIGAHHKQPLPPLADQKEKDTKPAPKAKKLINFQFKLPAAALDHEQPQAIKLPPMKPKQEATKGPPKSARVLPPIQMTKNPEVGTDCKQEASRAKETVPMKKDNTISTEQTPGKKRSAHTHPLLPHIHIPPRPSFAIIVPHTLTHIHIPHPSFAIVPHTYSFYTHPLCLTHTHSTLIPCASHILILHSSLVPHTYSFHTHPLCLTHTHSTPIPCASHILIPHPSLVPHTYSFHTHPLCLTHTHSTLIPCASHILILQAHPPAWSCSQATSPRTTEGGQPSQNPPSHHQTKAIEQGNWSYSRKTKLGLHTHTVSPKSYKEFELK